MYIQKCLDVCLDVADIGSQSYQEGWSDEVGTNSKTFERHEVLNQFLCLSDHSKVVGSHVLAAVICGGDSGVKMTDALSEVLQLQGNGTLSEGHRRDKLLQQEAVKAAGLRFARTMSGTSWEEARNWGEV